MSFVPVVVRPHQPGKTTIVVVEDDVLVRAMVVNAACAGLRCVGGGK
jgi:hypothetical protein